MKARQIEMTIGAFLLALGIEIFVWARLAISTFLAFDGGSITIAASNVIRYYDNYQILSLILMPIGASILAYAAGERKD